MEAEAAAEKIPIVGPVVGELLFILGRAAQAASILELGTATGYSAIFLARACAAVRGMLVTIEIDPGMAARAQANLERAGLKANARISLWCHCPYYLQGATHFGVICRLAELLARLGGFDLDTGELESNWSKLDDHIRGLVEKNEDLKKLVSGLRQQKRRGTWPESGPPPRSDGKVINLLDFLEPH